MPRSKKWNISGCPSTRRRVKAEATMRRPNNELENDYYAILGVPPDASQDAIEAAYRHRTQELERDQGRSAGAAAQLKLVNEAYRVLSDPQQRHSYDRIRWVQEVERSVLYGKSQPPQAVRWLVWAWLLPLSILLLLIILGVIVALTLYNDGEQAAAPPTLTPSPAATLSVEVALLSQMPVQHNADWTPVIREVDGVEMVLVPRGCFVMGEMPPSAAEREERRVCFERHFWIDRYEVTNAQFTRLGGQAARPSQWIDDDRPRENITWAEAAAFCALRGGRLPSGAEWEYAARGPDNWLYPWGDTFDPTRVVFRDTFRQAGAGAGRPETQPVARRPEGASWVGAQDLLGNVQEWIADSPTAGTHFLRGGSALNNELSLLTEMRSTNQLVEIGDFNGFRCVRD